MIQTGDQEAETFRCELPHNKVKQIVTSHQ